MPFMGELFVGDKVQITFRAAASNSRSTAVLSGYVPDGVNPAPPTLFDMVAPGGVQTQRTEVGPAFALKITVDVPDGGRGLLEVFANGELRDRDEVGDTIWTYGVV